MNRHNTLLTPNMNNNVFKKMMVVSAVAALAMVSQAQAASVSISVGNAVVRVSDNSRANHKAVAKQQCRHEVAHHDRYDRMHRRDKHECRVCKQLCHMDKRNYRR